MATIGTDIIDREIARRTEAGLKLTFLVPDRPEPYTCFPSNETMKAKWIASAERKGWTLVPNAA